MLILCEQNHAPPVTQPDNTIPQPSTMHQSAASQHRVPASARGHTESANTMHEHQSHSQPATPCTSNSHSFNEHDMRGTSSHIVSQRILRTSSHTVKQRACTIHQQPHSKSTSCTSNNSQQTQFSSRQTVNTNNATPAITSVIAIILTSRLYVRHPVE